MMFRLYYISNTSILDYLYSAKWNFILTYSVM